MTVVMSSLAIRGIMPTAHSTVRITQYQQLKELGVVHSAKEFIQLFHPDEQEDTP